MHEQKHIYSLRKLSVGLASVIVGTCFFISTNRQNVKADTVNVGEQQTSTMIQQDSSEKQEQDSNEQNDQTNVSNSKTEQQQSTPSAKDVENVDSNLNDTNKLDNATKPVESEANQKFDQVKNKFKQDTSIDANVPSSVTKGIKKIQTNTLKVVKESIVNLNSLKESKAVNPNNNGGFDEATWGKLDVTKWQGFAQNGVYQLTDYTGDPSHIIVPNEADFEQAGKSTNGLQVGITSNTAHLLLSGTNQGHTIAFSKTNNKKVKAIGTDWIGAFQYKALSKFDGSNLDVSSITNMSYMFSQNQISDLTSLANWNVSNVTAMSGMFWHNSISDLTPLANWNVSNVTYMNAMFAENPDLIDVKPIANWNISNVDVVNNGGYFFMSDTKLNLTNINNTPLMQGFLKTPDALQGATFITNNADLVKATTGKDVPTLTNTAKRTIVFNIPHATPRTIVQTINYKAIVVSVQVDFDSQKIVKTYPVKASDWQLDTSKQNDAIIVNGQVHFKAVKIPHINGYKAHLVRNKLNPNMMMISLFALPAISTDPTGNKTVDQNANKGQSDINKKQDTSSSSVTDKANNSHDLHNDSKKQNDQSITSNKETDHTINVSAQAVDPTVEPEDHNTVASQNNSTTSAQTQQSSTNDAEQPTNISNTDRVVNDKNDDDFADPSRKENNANKRSNSSSNRSKPEAGKIIHVNSKTPQNGLNEPVKGQSVATHPATTSVINNSKSDAKQLPQTNESDSFNYTALSLLLGLDVAIAAVGVEKKRKKY